MPQSSLRTSRYRSKISELDKRISDIQSASSSPSFSFSPQRLENALVIFEQLKNLDFCESESRAPEEISDFDRRFYELYAKVVVDLNACVKPEIDPNEGWVSAHSNNFDNDQTEEFVIDTQLMTLTLKPSSSAGLIEWLFKPRKLNFLFSHTNSNLTPSFICGISDPENNVILFDSEVAHLEIFLHTPDQIELHTTAIASYQGNEIKIFSEYIVKAGMGAHRQNSTTGFAFNYRYESDIPFPPGHELVLQLHPIMPSRNVAAAEAYLLHSVGAVNTDAFPLSTTSLFSSKDYPQGLHGLRLVDTQNPYAMDIRSTRPLNTVNVSPFYQDDSSIYVGSTISLATDLSSHVNTSEKNTIFVSLI